MGLQYTIYHFNIQVMNVYINIIMFELRNESNIPLTLTMSPVQNRGKHTSQSVNVSIPAHNSFSSKVESGTKYISITKDQTSSPFWEGIVPTHLSQPIIINAYDHLLTYKGRILTNLISSSLLTFNSTHVTLFIVMTLIIFGVWMYYKRRK
jgi:hypothetical protein